MDICDLTGREQEKYVNILVNVLFNSDRGVKALALEQHFSPEELESYKYDARLTLQITDSMDARLREFREKASFTTN